MRLSALGRQLSAKSQFGLGFSFSFRPMADGCFTEKGAIEA
jgi:hypothetical protein